MSGLAIVGVIAIGALYQLPATPLAGRVSPDRPVSTTPSQAAHVEPQQTPPQPARRSMPAITYPVRGTLSYGVLPSDPAVIGRAGRVMTFKIAVEGGIRGIDRPALTRHLTEAHTRFVDTRAPVWAARASDLAHTAGVTLAE